MTDNSSTIPIGALIRVTDPRHAYAGRFSLCEVHFDDDGALSRWTADPAMVPQGETLEDLSNDLAGMIGDTYKWKPVAYSSLRAGMRFEPTGVNVEAMISALNAASVIQA